MTIPKVNIVNGVQMVIVVTLQSVHRTTVSQIIPTPTRAARDVINVVLILVSMMNVNANRMSMATAANYAAKAPIIFS